MEFFLKFDIHLFSIMLLVILFFTMKLRHETAGTSVRLFFRLLWMTVFLLILEMLSWKYDRVPGQNSLNYFFNMLFAWLTSLITCMLASYLDYHIFESYHRLKKRWFYLQPFIITGILVLINFFRPILFSVSETNIYQRESWMILLPLLNISVFAYICYLAFKNKKNIQKEVVWVILLYTLVPALIAFLQVLVLGLFLLWPTMAVIVVLTYIFLETVSTSKDYLTGLMSRHRIDGYLEYMLDYNKTFVLVMIDLNNFKTINDTHGHIKGDLALKVFSEYLQRFFADEKVIGRYAGDEFILILEKLSSDEILEKLNLLSMEMEKLYSTKKLEFLISFAYGYYERQSGEKIKYNEIMNMADERMYSQKEFENAK